MVCLDLRASGTLDLAYLGRNTFWRRKRTYISEVVFPVCYCKSVVRPVLEQVDFSTPKTFLAIAFPASSKQCLLRNLLRRPSLYMLRITLLIAMAVRYSTCLRKVNAD